MVKHKKVIKPTREQLLIKDLKKIFRSNPNSILQTRSIFHTISNEYGEAMIYCALTQLVKDRIINKTILSRQKYYWLRRKEPGD